MQDLHSSVLLEPSSSSVVQLNPLVTSTLLNPPADVDVNVVSAVSGWGEYGTRSGSPFLESGRRVEVPSPAAAPAISPGEFPCHPVGDSGVPTARLCPDRSEQLDARSIAFASACGASASDSGRADGGSAKKFFLEMLPLLRHSLLVMGMVEIERLPPADDLEKNFRMEEDEGDGPLPSPFRPRRPPSVDGSGRRRGMGPIDVRHEDLCFT
mmetsp:Transcript_26897/g.53729  ORF Transcript_26897/g.53729 Transcript_26897/m.53729 type:complete len:211 (+) Transcript_26897:2503-3135(+)